MKIRITRPLFQGAQMLAPGVIIDVPASVGEVYLRQKAAIVLEEDKQIVQEQAQPESTKPGRGRKKHAQADS